MAGAASPVDTLAYWGYSYLISNREGHEMQTEASATKTGTVFQVMDRDEPMIQHYMAKGFDRETAEALAVLNNRGQHIVEAN